jgi:hypothetical protein
LLDEANHSENEDETSKFVHVAAPGGEPIPGWTGPNSMGAVPGTSQAAAFAAGIAANMLNNYPEVYRLLGVLKLRMQACSWPLPYFFNGNDNRAANRLAAGVLDPAICALDPTVAWVKREGRGWSSAPLKRWIDPPAGAFKDDTGQRTGPHLSSVLRVMKTDGSGDATWTIYSFVKKRGKVDDRYGQIKKDVAASIDEKAILEFCDGSKVALSELTDILPPIYKRECQPPSTVDSGSDRTRSPG